MPFRFYVKSVLVIFKHQNCNIDNFGFRSFDIFKSEIFTKIKIQSVFKCYNGSFQLSEISQNWFHLKSEWQDKSLHFHNVHLRVPIFGLIIWLHFCTICTYQVWRQVFSVHYIQFLKRGGYFSLTLFPKLEIVRTTDLGRLMCNLHTLNCTLGRIFRIFM